MLVSPAMWAADFEFLPCDSSLSVSFEGKTQAGKSEHRFEIRQLGYEAGGRKIPASGYYVIYFAGEKYGPEVLVRIDGHSPILKRSGNDVTVYYIKGVKTHVKQEWKLAGHTALFMSEKTISYSERPTHNNPVYTGDDKGFQ